MRVCLDYQPAVAQRAGIGRYTRVLAQHLAGQRHAEDTLALFYIDFRRRGDAPPVQGAEARAWRMLPGALVQQAWKRLGWPDYARLAGPADVYHFTNFIIPPLRTGRAAVTIFDMSFERFPQFAEARNLSYLRARLDASIARADAIITISGFSADEIESCHPGARGKLHAIPLGIDPSFSPARADEVAAMRRRLGLERPYLLSVGTLEPRKNYGFMADAFDALESAELELVIAGAPGWKCEPILEHLRRARRADRIRYVRYVPDGMLGALYTGAEAFLLTSHYEGFGFPPLEAMACGTPVVSAATGSLPEILGDAAVWVPTFACEAWRAAIRGLLEAPEAERAARVARGRARAAAYPWERTAAATWRVYRELAGAGAPVAAGGLPPGGCACGS